MDDVQIAIDLGRDAMVATMKLSLPLLLTGLVVGVIISVLQAATQIQEQTLSFVPKIVAVALAAFFILPWMIQVMVEYTEDLFVNMAHMFG